MRLAAERDKVIEEVKRKYAEKFQEAKLKCAVAEEELTKLQLNRCLAVIFWRFLATGPRKLVVQPGKCEGADRLPFVAFAFLIFYNLFLSVFVKSRSDLYGHSHRHYMLLYILVC